MIYQIAFIYIYRIESGVFMKKSTKQILLIQLLMYLVILIGILTKNIMEPYIAALFLGIYLSIIIFIFGIDLKRSLRQKEVLVNTMICVLIYFIFIYLCGLFIGFTKSAYTLKVSNLIYNIIPTILIITLSELIRYEFIKKSNTNMFITIFSCLLFIFFEIYININLYNFSITDKIFEFIGMVVLTSISKNIFLTILCVKTDYINTILYRYILEIYVFIVPIIPSFGPYINAVLSISLPIILSYIVLVSFRKKINDKPKYNNKDKLLKVLIVILLLLMVLLNSGYFKYRILTIGSNSMQTFMNRGDVIIVEKLKGKEIETIKKDKDILVFYYENKIIAHRVYKIIKKDNLTYFKTKGDNNDQVDESVTSEEDVIGVVKYRIKYIGLPSVWLQELLG